MYVHVRNFEKNAINILNTHHHTYVNHINHKNITKELLARIVSNSAIFDNAIIST